MDLTLTANCIIGNNPHKMQPFNNCGIWLAHAKQILHNVETHFRANNLPYCQNAKFVDIEMTSYV